MIIAKEIITMFRKRPGEGTTLQEQVREANSPEVVVRFAEELDYAITIDDKTKEEINQDANRLLV
jgi:hypothetical protein